MRRLIAATFLLLDALSAAVWVAGLVPLLETYSALTAVLVFARGLVGALEGASGVMLLARRLPAPVLGQMAFAASAALAVLETGFRLVPTNAEPTYRWVWVVVQGVFALGMIMLLRAIARDEE